MSLYRYKVLTITQLFELSPLMAADQQSVAANRLCKDHIRSLWLKEVACMS